MHGALKLALAWTRPGLLAVACALSDPERPRIAADPLLVDDGAALRALEDRGFSFERVVGRDGLAVLREVVAAEMSGVPAEGYRRRFEPDWLDPARGHFELVGVVNRIDRRHLDPGTCGEVRLVYRLVLTPPKRPPTRMPMTVNVRTPQRGDCAAIAERWSSRGDLEAILRDLPHFTKLELNFQSIHVPAIQTDMDDHAEYVLRAFDFVPDSAASGRRLVPSPLFNTPRTDLDPAAREKLLRWIASDLDAIERGEAVVPTELLSSRAVSVSPRGLLSASNRPFSSQIQASEVARLPLAGRALTSTPELLLRRLDELTCVGCHQTRGVAGFHLLGEERNPKQSFNALAVGRSPHLVRDLAWRAKDLEAARLGAPSSPRPFSSHSEGRSGEACGLGPGLGSWRCREGLRCRDIHHGPWGVCAPTHPGVPGAPCEDAVVEPNARELGAVVTAKPADEACPAPTGDVLSGPFCAPNWLGFTGGMCSARCSEVGAVTEGSICAPLPAAGYEADCFYGREPIETCLKRHFVTAKVAMCDRDHPCRDDFGCTRVPGAPSGVGACVPPYFILQARVDGPVLDR